MYLAMFLAYCSAASTPPSQRCRSMSTSSGARQPAGHPLSPAQRPQPCPPPSAPPTSTALLQLRGRSPASQSSVLGAAPSLPGPYRFSMVCAPETRGSLPRAGLCWMPAPQETATAPHPGRTQACPPTAPAWPRAASRPPLLTWLGSPGGTDRRVLLSTSPMRNSDTLQGRAGSASGDTQALRPQPRS